MQTHTELLLNNLFMSLKLKSPFLWDDLLLGVSY